MKRPTKALFIVSAALFIAITAYACKAVDSSAKSVATPPPSASPALPDKEATPAPDRKYSAGEKPFSGLKPENITRIRMIINSDAQPPDFPDPFKDAAEPADLQAIIGILNQVEVKKTIEMSDMPIGATGYTLLVNQKDGTLLYIYFYGDDILSEPGSIYKISKLPDMDALYKTLEGRTRLLAGGLGNSTMEERNGCLFEMDGWKYYFEPADNGVSGCLVRENENGKVETVYKRADIIHPAIFHGHNRIVLVQDQNPDSRIDDNILISFNPDGTEEKKLQAQHGVVGTPMWDGDSLYYVGWAKDENYPRPLYKVDEYLEKQEKAMDIPGALLAVRSGNVYCLANGGKSVLNLPSGAAVSTFASPIGHTEYSAGKWVLYGADGTIYEWTVETGAVKAPKN